MADKKPAISGAAIVEAIKKSGIEMVVSVPDRVTSESVLRRVASDSQLKLVRVCKEDEGLSICAAMAACDKRALMLMQCTGLLDSVNALRACGVEFSQPLVMMVGLLGHESEEDPANSPLYGVRIVPRVMTAMDVDFDVLHSAGDEARIVPAINRAYEKNAPLVLFIGRSPT